MTDHLEPYKRMVRSMRFVPPLGRNQLSVPLPEPPAMPLPQPRVSAEESPSVLEPDPSEHVAALVREAVSKPTVLPVTYAIRENIADTISRLAKPKPPAAVIILPKIPQPDPNWKPSETSDQQTKVDWNKQVESSQMDTTAPAVATAEPIAVEKEPETLPESEVKAPTAESITVEEPPQEVAETESQPSTAEAETVEQEPETLPGTERKAPTAESITVEDTPQEVAETESQPSTAEAETVEQEPETLPESEVKAPTAESITVEEPPQEVAETESQHSTAEAETVEQEPETLPESEVEAPTAEPEENVQQPSFVEKVSHQIEAVTDTIKKAAHDLVESVVPGLAEPASKQSNSAVPVEPSPTAQEQVPESKNSQEQANSTTPKDKKASQLDDEIPAKPEKSSKGKTKRKAKGFGR